MAGRATRSTRPVGDGEGRAFGHWSDDGKSPAGGQRTRPAAKPRSSPAPQAPIWQPDPPDIHQALSALAGRYELQPEFPATPGASPTGGAPNLVEFDSMRDALLRLAQLQEEIGDRPLSPSEAVRAEQTWEDVVGLAVRLFKR